MLTLLAVTALSIAQLTADDARRPRVPLCTAQEGELDRVLAIRRADERVWWFPALDDRARPYVLADEVTARQRDWHRDRLPLTVDGQAYRYAREDAVETMAFRRYNRPLEPIDGVPAMSPLGSDGEEIWTLLDPVGCRFAVWTRAPAAT